MTWITRTLVNTDSLLKSMLMKFYCIHFAQMLSASRWMLLAVSDHAVRGGYLLCFLDDGQGMSPGTNAVS